jgi:Zn-finger nucleic acid-binding protein
MKCPNCQATLLITEKKGVEIDYCPECRGIWLDRGELEKIMERSAEHYSKKENYESDYKRYGYQEHDDDYNKRHPHKKKKSFLDDFFDF